MRSHRRGPGGPGPRVFPWQEEEISHILLQLQSLPASDLYQSNKTFCHWLSNGFLLKHEDRNKKDLYTELMDIYPLPEQLASLFTEHGDEVADTGNNIYRLVNQLEIEGQTRDGGLQLCIPDGILYVNGLPLVVFGFKSAVREEEATIYDAWRQLCVRYKRDIPKLYVYNALCILSDGVN